MIMRKALLTTMLLAVAVPLFAADPDPLQWHKTPDAYFMTAQERAEWKNVFSPGDAQRFIDEYYRKRGEQFRKDLRTLIDVTDSKFRLDKVRGSDTERGRVFMLLGKPSTSRTNRDVEETRMGLSPSNILENKALMGTEWVYERDRLPKGLGISQLKVNFVYDARRGFEVIDNMATVEPRLIQAAEVISAQYITATQNQTATRSMMPISDADPSPDPLWNATPALNGAVFAADAFLSPREEPYYAFTFFIPPGTPSFGEWSAALLVALVRDEAGQQVVSDRQRVELGEYDKNGARYFDRSILLPPGKYEGFFALYSPDGASLLSSHRTSFEVAEPTAARASGLFLTSRIDTLEKQDPLDPFTFVATKYAVRADRRFTTADKVAVFTVVSNPTGSPTPKLMQRMVFRRDGKEFARTQLEPAQITQTGPNTFLVGNSFAPATFPAGHYSLVMQVHDFNAPEGSTLRIPGHVLTTEFDVVSP